jgi:cbb3-type cytochrome oxidase subunit 3
MADLSVRLKLAAVWTALMFLFVYADLLSLFRPGELAEISAGNMGPVDVSQGSLLIAAVVVTIPALMIVVSAAAPFPLVRWLSLGVGILYILVSVSNLIGESWAYYLLFGVLEIGLAGLVVAYSYRWRGASWRAYGPDVWSVTDPKSCYLPPQPPISPTSPSGNGSTSRASGERPPWRP